MEREDSGTSRRCSNRLWPMAIDDGGQTRRETAVISWAGPAPLRVGVVFGACGLHDFIDPFDQVERIGHHAPGNDARVQQGRE